MRNRAWLAAATLIAVLLGTAVIAAADASPSVPIGSPTAAGQPSTRAHLGAVEGLEAWVNVRVIQELVHHTTGVIAAVVLFWAASFVMQRLMHDGPIKRCVLLLDELVLLCLFVYFAYELFVYLLAEVHLG